MDVQVASWLDRPEGAGRGRPPSLARAGLAAKSIVAAALTAGMLAAGAAGCGSGGGLPLADVRGVVTYKGKPIEKGNVVFSPQAGTPGPQAVGEIGSDGSYRVMTNDRYGAAIGKHKVTIESRAEQSEAAYKSLKIPKLLTPTKYANEYETPLTFEVKEGGNEFNIDLVD